jgi:hypothetical protein
MLHFLVLPLPRFFLMNLIYPYDSYQIIFLLLNLYHQLFHLHPNHNWYGEHFLFFLFLLNWFMFAFLLLLFLSYPTNSEFIYLFSTYYNHHLLVSSLFLCSNQINLISVVDVLRDQTYSKIIILSKINYYWF